MSCGIMRIQADGRVIDFEEKPKTPEKLDRVRTDPTWLEKLGLNASGRPYLASMGIYLFNRSLLVDLLRSSDATDFGHELLPKSIQNHRVQAHLFDGYWEDIGTVGAFHKANIELTRDDPPFDFASEDGPIFTRPRFLPCSRILGATVKNSLICDGSVIGRGSVIENSVIGVRSRIGENVTVRDTYIMGIDYPENPQHLAENTRLNRPSLRHRGQFRHRAGDHRQECPHRPQRPDPQPGRRRERRGDLDPRDPRRHRRDPQVHRPARRVRHLNRLPLPRTAPICETVDRRSSAGAGEPARVREWEVSGIMGGWAIR